jgi:hypothetical protein
MFASSLEITFHFIFNTSMGVPFFETLPNNKGNNTLSNKFSNNTKKIGASCYVFVMALYLILYFITILGISALCFLDEFSQLGECFAQKVKRTQKIHHFDFPSKSKLSYLNLKQ